ncbi:very short patch repair endonuclease [Chryseobacterium gotjawalense]|uniref:Very short patch repair endonuclease n=1 Tax=Chryseobacterium gotjawalense TaxID=3042315 RepID=A0ABY8REW3_9FLAO|nr:very short patch repair endonuclease [Chryseobacterium sp. wdc7]WHF52511.1 very short patch repair endonuclease [Chryseobacterium sp. wdc7]
MPDRHTTKQRSYNMSKIKSKDTKPEILLRKLLFKEGFRYRINNSKLPGKPDIVLKKYKTVIFVNGCFWHGHQDCRYFVMPKTRTEFWSEKIKGNKERDQRNTALLQEEGWNVITVWECELKKNTVEDTVKLLTEKIKGSAENPAE